MPLAFTQEDFLVSDFFCLFFLYCSFFWGGIFFCKTKRFKISIVIFCVGFSRSITLCAVVFHNTEVCGRNWKLLSRYGYAMRKMFSSSSPLGNKTELLMRVNPCGMS